MKLSEITSKKVAGVPIVYLAAGAAVILGYFAWKMPKTSSTETEPETAATDPEDTGTGTDDPYDSLTSDGTVVVQPQTPVTTPVVEETNDTWGRAAAKWLYENNVTDPASAQSLVYKILQGEDLSYQEGQWRNKVYAAIGLPPEPLGRVGISKPAAKQFTPPGRHTVQGSGDNTFRQLSILYYGRNDQSSIDLLQSGNSRFGNIDGPLKEGEEVYIPAWREPTYYTATSTARTPEDIGAKNGVPAASIVVINDNLTWPVSVGTKVRVR